MTNHAIYPERAVCLQRLMTPDPEAASRWLSAVLGWSVSPAAHLGPRVWAARVDEAPVAIIAQTHGDDTQPATWDHFINVSNANATVEALIGRGGKQYRPPVPMGHLGTTAMALTAQQVPVWLWQPRVLQGFVSRGGLGKVAFFEIRNADPEAVAADLSAQFRWTANGTVLKDNGGATVYVRPLPREDLLSHWLTAYTVDNLDQAINTSNQAGGRLFLGPEVHPALERKSALVTSPAAGPMMLIEAN